MGVSSTDGVGYAFDAPMPTNVADTMNMAQQYPVLNIAVFFIDVCVCDVNGGHRRVGIVRMNVMAAFNVTGSDVVTMISRARSC